MKFRHLLSLAFLFLVQISAIAQNRPVGFWRAHMPYNNANSVATNGTMLFSASDHSFFTFNAATGQLAAYSKVEGMSDVGVSYVSYDETTGFVIIAYTNTNIDLFQDETFFNIPDLKLKSIPGTKRINHIYTSDGIAYLSCSFGVVVLNLDKKETKETYTFLNNNQTVEVLSFSSTANYLFAVTPNGLYRANKNNPNLQSFSSWQQISSKTALKSIAAAAGKVYVSDTNTLYLLDNDTLAIAYNSPYEIRSIDAWGDHVWINESIKSRFAGKVKLLNPGLQMVDSFKCSGLPVQTVVLTDSSVWVADIYNGLFHKIDSTSASYVRPEGPISTSAFDILPYDGQVWVAHGGYNATWTYIYNPQGFSFFDGGKWKVYNRNTVPALKEATDFIALAKDPADGTLYAASYRSGLFILKTDGSYQYLKDTLVFEPTQGDPTSYRLSGLSFDLDGNLWITQAGAPHELVVKTKAGEWFSYAGSGSALYSAYVLTDDYNQKWYILPGTGAAVYDDNHTPENGNDDLHTFVSTSLISSATNCIVKDKEGAIWIGTNDGIGIIHCPGEIMQGTCALERPIVQYDQFAGYLFQNESVKTIAVDGANRKWIGTSNGAWLISPDGEKIIYRFTEENSPLPANVIQKISIDPVTGDVYFGTSLGLVSYRSTATEGTESNTQVTTFPNPVPSGYSGTIAIRGLSENADVRITDVSGQLVYRTRALGGQAVWNGKDYKGRRPQSGVYLIFATNKDGSQTHAGKMIFID